MDFKSFQKKYQKKPVQENLNEVNDEPLISVCVQTYQHVNYIRQCLDGILMQKTTFPIEVLLGDDESTDGTREICIKYAQKHPDKIRLFLHQRENNIKINGTPTGRFNFMYNLYSARGKFTALCEGDDYWTDPLKLQKQVDFLEANDEFAICFHQVQQLNQFNGTTFVYPDIEVDRIYNIQDYIKNNLTAACSIIFKKDKLGEMPDWFSELPFGDLGLILFVMHNSNKKGMVLRGSMAVYRIHEKGIHGSFHKNKRMLIEAYKQQLIFNKLIAENCFGQDVYSSRILEKQIATYQKIASLYKEEGKSILALRYKLLSRTFNFKWKNSLKNFY